jgi:hypothetical protein
MGHRFDPVAQWRAGLAVWRVMAEAQVVMTLRVMGMWGVLPASRGENRRMVVEKAPAFAQGAVAAGTALMAGRAPEAVVVAAVRPVRRRVAANAKRLSKPRAPKA